MGLRRSLNPKQNSRTKLLDLLRPAFERRFPESAVQGSCIPHGPAPTLWASGGLWQLGPQPPRVSPPLQVVKVGIGNGIVDDRNPA